MNWTLVSALLRQRLSSPMRLFLLFMLTVPGLLLSVFSSSLAPLVGGGYWMALVLAAGAIGQDVSSGVLHLTFARPVTRPSYVASRWFGAALGGFALAIARLLVAAVLITLRGATPSPLELVAAVIEDALLCAVAAAVMVALSSFVNGLGDVALFAMASISLQIGHTIAQVKGWVVAERVLVEIQRTFEPKLTFAWLFGNGAQAWSPYVTAVSTVAFALALAMLVMNRRELSYAND